MTTTFDPTNQDDRIAERSTGPTWARTIPMSILEALAAPGEHWSAVLAAWEDLTISDRYELVKAHEANYEQLPNSGW